MAHWGHDIDGGALRASLIDFMEEHSDADASAVSDEVSRMLYVEKGNERWLMRQLLKRCVGPPILLMRSTTYCYARISSQLWAAFAAAVGG